MCAGEGDAVLPSSAQGNPSWGWQLRGWQPALCQSFSVTREIRTHNKTVLKQSQVHYWCQLIWEVRPPLDFPWLPPTSDEHRNWFISLGNVEGNGSRLQHFYIVIIYCYMQPEKGWSRSRGDSWCPRLSQGQALHSQPFLSPCSLQGELCPWHSSCWSHCGIW